MFSAESSTHAVAGAHETGGIIIMYSQIVVRSPWRRKWQSPAVFLPGESLGQRSLAGHGPWGRRESARRHILAIVNSTAMNTGMHVVFGIRVFVFSRYMPRSGIAG